KSCKCWLGLDANGNASQGDAHLRYGRKPWVHFDSVALSRLRRLAAGGAFGLPNPRSSGLPTAAAELKSRTSGFRMAQWPEWGRQRPFQVSAAAELRGGVPARVRPQLSAHGRVGEHEADRIGDLLGANQPVQLRERQNVLADVVLAQRAHHRRVGESWVNHSAAYAMEHGLFHDRRSRTLETGFGAGVRDLAAVALRRNGTDEHDRALHPLSRLPALEAAGSAIFGDASDHLERPVDRRHEVHVDDPLELVRRIDPRIARFPVDTDRKIVARDTGRRHADGDGVYPAADGIEHRG